MNYFPLGHFYSKGTRLDSRCKGCVNRKKRAVYSQKSGGEITQRLKTIAGFLIHHEMKELQQFNEKLNQIIRGKSKHTQSPSNHDSVLVSGDDTKADQFTP